MSAADVPAGEQMAEELTLTGRITTASNATFLGAIGDTSVVYKPVAAMTRPSTPPAAVMNRMGPTTRRVSSVRS